MECLPIHFICWLPKHGSWISTTMKAFVLLNSWQVWQILVQLWFSLVFWRISYNVLNDSNFEGGYGEYYIFNCLCRQDVLLPQPSCRFELSSIISMMMYNLGS